jgi:NAD+ synthase
VLRPALLEAVAQEFRELERESTSAGVPGIVVTLPWKERGRLHNAVALVADGRSELRFKHELPNYGVFDEKRIFEAGPLPEPVKFRNTRLGLPICEDIWFDAVTTHLAQRGAQLLLVPNGSPFEVDKFAHRLELARMRAAETGMPLAYVNQIGGQDELVFDGGSFVMNPDGALACLLPFWRESMALTRWHEEANRFRCGGSTQWSAQPRLESIYCAMVLGLRDYVRKNHFPGIVLGMSGGIDSALTAAVAVDALGAGHVRGVRLPSRFTSPASLDDANESATLMGMRLDTIPIEAPVAASEGVLAPLFEGRPRDVTEENIQARIRGVLLMGISNKFGELLVTTGNKSEMSVGYATLYGDTCGGYSVHATSTKTEVARLSQWRNEHLPEGRAGRAAASSRSDPSPAPTAELRPNQTDQDSLPPRRVDAILRALVEEELSVADIAARGLPRDTVTRVQRLLYSAELQTAAGAARGENYAQELRPRPDAIRSRMRFVKHEGVRGLGVRTPDPYREYSVGAPSPLKYRSRSSGR